MVEEIDPIDSERCPSVSDLLEEARAKAQGKKERWGELTLLIESEQLRLFDPIRQAVRDLRKMGVMIPNTGTCSPLPPIPEKSRSYQTSLGHGRTLHVGVEGPEFNQNGEIFRHVRLVFLVKRGDHTEHKVFFRSPDAVSYLIALIAQYEVPPGTQGARVH